MQRDDLSPSSVRLRPLFEAPTSLGRLRTPRLFTKDEYEKVLASPYSSDWSHSDPLVALAWVSSWPTSAKTIDGTDFVAYVVPQGVGWVSRFPEHSKGRECGCYSATGELSCVTRSDRAKADNGVSVSLSSLVYGHIRLPPASFATALTMFSPLVEGTLSASGVYMRIVSPLQNKVPQSQQWSPSDAYGYLYDTYFIPVSYTRTTLPLCYRVAEAGTFSAGTFSASARKLISGHHSPSSIFDWRNYAESRYGTTNGFDSYPAGYFVESFRVRACLARGDIYSQSGTKFVLSVLSTVEPPTSYWYNAHADVFSAVASDISFPFVPPTADHSVLTETKNSTFDYYAGSWWMSNWLAGNGGYPVGECPAIASRTGDHGSLSRVSFQSGTLAWQWPYPAYSTLDGSSYSSVPNAAQWAAFPYSRPVNAIQPDSAAMPPSFESEPQAATSPTVAATVIDGQAFPYPTGQAQAVASCIQSHAAFVDAGTGSSHASYVETSPADGSFVIAGKKVLSVELSFSPVASSYTGINADLHLDTESPAVLPTGIVSATSTGTAYGPSPTATMNETTGFYQGYSYYAANYQRYAYWWKYGSTVSCPGTPASVFSTPSVAYSGDYWDTSGTASSLSYTTFEPLQPLTRQQHDNIVLHEHVRFASRLPESFCRQDWPLAAQLVEAVPNEPGRLSVAPLLGTYTLSRFSVGDIPAAGNIFRYGGAGSWSMSGSVDYTLVLPGAHVEKSYKLWSAWNNEYYVATDYTQKPATVSVNEDWDLSTDHVELYAAISTGLQEYGELSVSGTQPDDEVRSPELPKGRASSAFVIHSPDTPPRPTLSIFLSARTVMRGSMKMTLTAPEMMSFAGNFSQRDSVVSQRCRGSQGPPLSTAYSSLEYAPLYETDGYVDSTSGPRGVKSQTVQTDHGLVDFEPISFSGSQTARLLAGETVQATNWSASEAENRSKPVTVHLGAGPVLPASDMPRLYTVSLKLNLADL